MAKIKNKFEVRGAETVIFINSPKYGMKEAVIDTVDLALAQEFPNTWCVHWDPTIRGFYCCGKIQQVDGKRITVYLHRWLTSCPDDLQVDHFDNETLNNKRDNLRILSNSENQQNPKRAQRNSNSGILGVCWHKSARRWIAQVEIFGKKHYCGAFNNIVAASNAIKKARAELMPYSKEAVALRSKEKT